MRVKIIDEAELLCFCGEVTARCDGGALGGWLICASAAVSSAAPWFARDRACSGHVQRQLLPRIRVQFLVPAAGRSRLKTPDTFASAVRLLPSMKRMIAAEIKKVSRRQLQGSVNNGSPSWSPAARHGGFQQRLIAQSARTAMRRNHLGVNAFTAEAVGWASGALIASRLNNSRFLRESIGEPPPPPASVRCSDATGSGQSHPLREPSRSPGRRPSGARLKSSGQRQR